MVGLNSSTAAEVEVAVLDTVADLYRTSVQFVLSVMELVEYLTDRISEELKIHVMKRTVLDDVGTFRFFDKSSVLKAIVGKQNELVNLLKNILEKTGNMSEHKDGNPFINAITSGNTSRFFDAQYWAKQLDQETAVLDNYQTELSDLQHIQFVMYRVEAVIIIIIFVVGMAGNGLLLTVFVRHKETRTIANCMLINLTVVDIVSLVVNLILDYLRSNKTWQFGWLGCQIYFFFSYLLFAVSTYSVAMISVQRFVAVRQLPSLAWCHQSNKTKYVLIAIVWGLGIILSVPHAAAAYIKIENCKAVSSVYLVPVYTSRLIVFCVVPLLITGVFSGLTAKRIRRSVREIPGEATGQQQVKHGRMVSYTVLVTLTALFVVSYAPFFLFKFLVFVVGISMSAWEYTLFNNITYHLRFVNCCLNPIVLFVMSKRYRGYIKRYCGQREVQPACSSKSSIETSL
jgi:gastrin-releasing peptide receptor